ncbi:caspase family protein [Rubrivivax rivuli]|nr:caspase family protein [Rubrivivax rivuli]
MSLFSFALVSLILFGSFSSAFGAPANPTWRLVGHTSQSIEAGIVSSSRPDRFLALFSQSEVSFVEARGTRRYRRFAIEDTLAVDVLGTRALVVTPRRLVTYDIVGGRVLAEIGWPLSAWGTTGPASNSRLKTARWHVDGRTILAANEYRAYKIDGSTQEVLASALLCPAVDNWGGFWRNSPILVTDRGRFLYECAFHGNGPLRIVSLDLDSARHTFVFDSAAANKRALAKPSDGQRRSTQPFEPTVAYRALAQSSDGQRRAALEYQRGGGAALLVSDERGRREVDLSSYFPGPRGVPLGLGLFFDEADGGVLVQSGKVLLKLARAGSTLSRVESSSPIRARVGDEFLFEDGVISGLENRSLRQGLQGASARVVLAQKVRGSDRVYVLDSSAWFYVLDLRSGRVLASTALGALGDVEVDPQTAVAASNAEGTVFAVGLGRRLYAVEAKGVRLTAQVQVQPSTVTAVGVGADSLHFTTTGGRWSRVGFALSSPPVVTAVADDWVLQDAVFDEGRFVYAWGSRYVPGGLFRDASFERAMLKVDMRSGRVLCKWEQGRELDIHWFFKSDRGVNKRQMIWPDQPVFGYKLSALKAPKPGSCDFQFFLVGVPLGEAQARGGNLERGDVIVSDGNGRWRWVDAQGRVSEARESRAHSEISRVLVSADGERAVLVGDAAYLEFVHVRDGRSSHLLALGHGQSATVLSDSGFFTVSHPSAISDLSLAHGERLDPLNLFWDVFYRPDLVEAVVEGRGLVPEARTDAIVQALRNPPPVVTLQGPQGTVAGTRQTVRFAVRPDGGGVAEVRAFHNGKLIASDGSYRDAQGLTYAPLEGSSTAAARFAQARRNASAFVPASSSQAGPAESVVRAAPEKRCRPGEPGDPCSGTLEIDVIPGAENTITVVAFNRDNTVQSLPASVSFRSTLPPEPSRLWLLSVGIDQFKGISALKNARKDALDFACTYAGRTALAASGQPCAEDGRAGTLFQPENIRVVDVLLDGAATKAAILQSLDKVSAQARPGDTFVWFVASHGLMDANSLFGIVAHDTQCLNTSCTEISGHITSNEILEASKKIKAMRQLVVLDTCHAGGLDNKLSGLYDARVSLLARNMGLHLYASAQATEQAQDGRPGTNGVFTAQLLEGLRGAAPKTAQGQISVMTLGPWARQRTLDATGSTQSPVIQHFGQDAALTAGGKP